MMKYLVMECHTGYAVLMDEESRFHKAANLHYTVGQTVTDPVLLTEDRGITVRRNTIMKIAAAAACLLMVSGLGIRYYLTHRTAESVVVVIEETQYEMQLNRSGDVIRVVSSGGSQAVLEEYNGKPRSAASAVNEILKIQKEEKELEDGDTVEVIIKTDSESTYETCKSDLEQEAAKLHLNADVQERGRAGKLPHETTTETETERPVPAEPEKPGSAVGTVNAKEHVKPGEPPVTPGSGIVNPPGTDIAEPPAPPAGHTVPNPELTAPNVPHTMPEHPAKTEKRITAPGWSDRESITTTTEAAQIRPGGPAEPPADPKRNEFRPGGDGGIVPPAEEPRTEDPADLLPREEEPAPKHEEPGQKPEGPVWRGAGWNQPEAPVKPEDAEKPAEPEKPEEPGQMPECPEQPEAPAQMPEEPEKPESLTLPEEPGQLPAATERPEDLNKPEDLNRIEEPALFPAEPDEVRLLPEKAAEKPHNFYMSEKEPPKP
ncbi:MAG: hypothetical protein IK130_06725 [Oscillospiraceae bacterium]|nr:hypothetical protein [Oscillospiraceae bacterium]